MADLDLAAAVAEMDRRLRAEDSLYEFLKQAWHVIEPSEEFVDNWHIQAVCEHLEEVSNGRVRNLLINFPPRMLKTIICSVAWPAWEWLHRPGTKFVYASYSWTLAEDASIRCRSLIKSEWYRVRWGDRFAILDDRDKKDLFSNNKGGERIITSPDATITGRGGAVIVADDPNHTKDKSDTVLDGTRNWWKNVMPSRLNNQKTGRRVVVQQRVDERDISGYILSTNRKAWVYLRLPNEYEEASPCKTVPLRSTNGKPWRDPRLHEGDLIFPDFLPKAESESLRREMGEYGYAGQYQQRPAPAEGGIIKKAWFQPWKQAKRPEKIEYIVQSWDTAMTERKMGAYSCCQTYGVFTDDKGLPALLLLSRFRARLEYPELRKVAMMLAEDYMDDNLAMPRQKRSPKNKPDMILIEDKSSGKSLISDMARAGVFATRFNPDRHGDKIGRVKLITNLLEGGRVYVPYAPPSFERPLNWVDQFLLSMGTFPNADARDDVDCLTQALLRLETSGWVFHPSDEAAKEKKKFAEEHREAIY